MLVNFAKRGMDAPECEWALLGAAEAAATRQDWSIAACPGPRGTVSGGIQASLSAAIAHDE